MLLKNLLNLKFAKELIQEVAQSTSAIIGLDVTIVDSSLKRVAGTGRYKETIGEILPPTCLFGYILNSGQEYITESPKKERVCTNCDKRDQCIEKGNIAFPLSTNGQTIGVISFIAFTQRQRDRLMEQRNELLKYLEHMAKLIVMAIQTQEAFQKLSESRDLLSGIVNSITEGIIAINREGTIVCCNKAAEHILQLKKQRPTGKPLADFIPDAPLLEVLKTGSSRINQCVNLRSHAGILRCVTTETPIFSKGKIIGAVALLKDLEEIYQIAHAFSENQPQKPIDQIIGRSKPLQEAKQMALRAAASSANVLLLGETGSGKELFARAIHFHSSRSNQPFVAVNCAAIPEDILESELFGYEEGAFTGAKRGGKPGKFELANGGTLFLDEVGDCSLRLQAKILRAIDQGEIQRVGGTSTIKVNIRVIAATNRDLETMVQQKEFREDLYYRLNVIPIHIPPLRQRKSDIPILIDAFIRQYAHSMKKSTPKLSSKALEILCDYSWPGNVRELQNVVQYILHICDEPIIKPVHLPQRLVNKLGKVEPDRIKTTPFIWSKEEWEKQAIKQGLQQLGNSGKAKEIIARQLGVSLTTIYRKIKKYGLE